MTYFSLQGDQLLSSHRRPSTRDVPARFVPQQLDFLRALGTTRDHILLRATAGSGKTTTLVEGAWHLGLAVNPVYYVYNRHATEGVGPRLPPNVRAMTLHAGGRGTLCRFRNDARLGVENDRSERLTAALDAVQGGATGGHRTRGHHRLLARVWDAAREQMYGSDAGDADLRVLAQQAGWVGEVDLQAVRAYLRDMRAASLADFAAGGLPDFTDLLWLPVTLGLEANTVGVALVDEAQDLTPLRQAFVLHMTGLNDPSVTGGRLVLVGDAAQAIYQYSGVEVGGMARLASAVGARELPLSVSFRCPSSHVALARQVNAFIESAPGATVGTVEHLCEDDLQLRRGDTVLCRTNSPLIALALRLMARGVSVNVRGRDLAATLSTAAEQAFPVPFRAEQLDALVATYQDGRLRPLQELIAEGDRRAKRAAQDLSDLCQCLTVLGREALRERGQTAGAADVAAALNRLYHEDADVLLSSVHRAKGLEWDSVTLLYPELMPLRGGTPEEEDAVLFVALTRSRRALRLAYGRKAWTAGERVLGGQNVLDPAPGQAVQEVLAGDADLTARFLAAHRRSRHGQEAAVTERRVAQARTVSSAELLCQELARRAAAGAALPVLPPPKGLSAVRVDDDRELALFAGNTPGSVPQVRLLLAALLDDPRPALADWARDSQARLSAVNAPLVAIDAEVLQGVQRGSRLSRACAPLLTRSDGGTLEVAVYQGGYFRAYPALQVSEAPGTLDLKVNGAVLTVDAVTGEQAGVPFDSLGTHLRLDVKRRPRRTI